MEDKIFIGDKEVCDIVWENSKGCEIPRIKYCETWLKSGFALGPDAPLQEGWIFAPQITANDKNFGFLRDITPDRWGRRLAKERYPDINSESGYIFSVDPFLRCGAVEFASDNADDSDRVLPMPLDYFYDLLKKWQKGEEIPNDDMLKITKAAASSGGSRPKIGLSDKGNLYIVKFPSIKDDIDVPLWEKVSLHMSFDCGIRTATCSLAELPDGRHALVEKRFDRNSAGKRIHFASAMNLAGSTDTQDNSYIDIAQVIERHGIPEDMRELWSRMAFNILTRNRDDHLRNHGFLRIDDKWILSPNYDLESSDDKPFHCLAIDDKGHCGGDIDLAIDMSPYYSLEKDDAKKIAEGISAVVSNWRKYAEKYGATKFDQKIMEKCFQQQEKKSFVFSNLAKLMIF